MPAEEANRCRCNRMRAWDDVGGGRWASMLMKREGI